MSLINKMLQDLDARGAQSSPGGNLNVKPVQRRDRGLAPLLWGVLGVLLAALLGAALTWHFMHRAQVAPQGLPLAPAPQVFPVTPPAMQPVTPPAMPPVTPPVMQPPTPFTPPASAQVPPRDDARRLDAVPAQLAPPQLAPLPLAHARSRPAENAQQPGPEPRAAMPAVPSPSPSPQAAYVGPVREAGSRQGAENAYRKGLGALQDGHVRAAIHDLEQALQIDPRHDAARQTLIGLLLENKRQDEAIQQLQQGLTLDPKQTALAMALARLQVEQGGPALQTLLRSLPYASERADYQAFVATLMEREQRHKEAVGHYEAALRLSPQNGVWWMGLGISLQADQRPQEAVIAYQRARAIGKLQPELDSFVEKKLQQLAK